MIQEPLPTFYGLSVTRNYYGGCATIFDNGCGLSLIAGGYAGGWNYTITVGEQRFTIDRLFASPAAAIEHADRFVRALLTATHAIDALRAELAEASAQKKIEEPRR